MKPIIKKKEMSFIKSLIMLMLQLNYEKAYELVPDNFEVILKLTGAYNDAGEEYAELRDEAEKYIDKAIAYAEYFS